MYHVQPCGTHNIILIYTVYNSNNYYKTGYQQSGYSVKLLSTKSIVLHSNYDNDSFTFTDLCFTNRS